MHLPENEVFNQMTENAFDLHWKSHQRISLATGQRCTENGSLEDSRAPGQYLGPAENVKRGLKAVPMVGA